MQRNVKRRWGLTAALALGLLAATQVGHADQPGDPKIPFEKYTLDNGLEVILLQDNKTPIVFVDLWYHVGSGDETPGKSGFAHLFEHMMFQGTKNTGEDRHFAVLQEIGASGVNGSTNFDRTNYFEQVPSNQLETALWLESERMGYLLPGVNEASLKNQIEVVRNERRQRIDNQPGAAARFARLAALYPEGHPYRYEVIGKHEDLESANIEDVRGFFKKWYVPSNATLVIAGDIDVDATKKLVEKWFGGFPKSAKPKHRDVPTPVLAKTERVTVEDPFSKLPSITYAWHSPAVWTAGDADLDIVGWLLTNPDTGRLYKRLVIETQLARSVAGGQSGQQRSGYFLIMVSLNPGADMAEVEKIVNEEVSRMIKEPVSDKELARAIVNIEGYTIRGLDSVSARAEELQRCNHYTGNPDCTSADLDRYRKATPASMQAAAAKYLGRPRVEVVNLPKGGK
jgi:predicted Zn-dependent peptidase